MISSEKRCIKCGEEKPLSSFTKHPGKSKGVKDLCKPCETTKRVEKIVKKKLNEYYRKTSKTVASLYIIQVLGGPIKVGISQAPKYRASIIQENCPFEIKLIKTVKNVQFYFEKNLHNHLSDYRIHGSWYTSKALSVALKYIKKNALAAKLKARATLALLEKFSNSQYNQKTHTPMKLEELRVIAEFFGVDPKDLI